MTVFSTSARTDPQKDCHEPLSHKTPGGDQNHRHASQHLAHVDNLKPGRVVIYCRVSRWHQNLEKQAANVTCEFEKMGFDVVTVLVEVASADAEDRVKLELAAIKAKQAEAILVAASTDRFLRGFRLDGENRRITVSPNALDWERFLALVDGAKLATLRPPDMDWRKVRGFQTKQGEAGRPPGPMTKKRRRELKAPEAVKLRQDGLSLRKISRALSVPCSTVRDWIEDAQEFQTNQGG